MKYLKWALAGLVLLPQTALAVTPSQLPGWGVIPGAYTPQQIIASVLTWILYIVGALAVAYLVYGGIVYITAAGNEERTKTGKGIVLQAIIGLIIIALAILIVFWLSLALPGI